MVSALLYERKFLDLCKMDSEELVSNYLERRKQCQQ